KSRPGEDPVRAVVLRKLELPAAVDEAINVAHRSHEEDPRTKDRHDPQPKISPAVALFGLGRWCARAGRVDLAARIDAELPELTEARLWRAAAAKKPFRAVVENEVAHSLMVVAMTDCSEEDVSPDSAPVTRPALQAEFARIAREF